MRFGPRSWAVAAIAALALSIPAAASTKPGLRVQSLAPFSVRGTNFKALEHVTVTLDGEWVRHTKANVKGVFVVTFKDVSVDRCDGAAIRAVGSRGTTATLRLPQLECASINPG
jgi:hypothetical protein